MSDAASVAQMVLTTITVLGVAWIKMQQSINEAKTAAALEKANTKIQENTDLTAIGVRLANGAMGGQMALTAAASRAAAVATGDPVHLSLAATADRILAEHQRGVVASDAAAIISAAAVIVNAGSAAKDHDPSA